MNASQPAHPKRRSLVRRLVRIFLKTLLTIFIILILVLFLVQTPFIQNIIRGKAEEYLSRKLNTRVRIGHLYVGFPRTIELKDIYLEDRKKDTLLSAGLIAVDLRMWGLLHHEVDIKEIHLQSLTAKVLRVLPDTTFNFQFIIDSFAGAPSQKKTDTTASTPMKIALHDLLLDKIRVVYKDTVTGNDVELYIDQSETKMDDLDLTAGKYNVSSFRLKGLKAKVWQEAPLPTVSNTTASNTTASNTTASNTTASNTAPSNTAAANTTVADTASTPLQIRVGSMDLENSSVDYRNTVGALFADIQLGSLSGGIKSFDLTRQLVLLDQLKLTNTTAAVRMGKTATHTGTSGSGTASKHSAQAAVKGGSPQGGAGNASDNGWRFLAASLRLDDNNIKYDDDNQPRLKKGMDYGHLGLQNLTIDADSLVYGPDTISGRIDKGQFVEQSGFRLNQLHTRFLYSSHRTILQDLLLETPGTTLRRSASLEYTSLADMLKRPDKTKLSIDLANSRIQVKDILTFVPDLASQPIFGHPSDVWNINARLNGTLDALTIQQLQFTGIKDLRLDASGRILHPMNIQRIQAALQLKDLSGSRAALLSLLPKGTMPVNLNLPAKFNLHGQLAGGMDDLQSDLVLSTSSGVVLVKGYAHHFRSTTNADYDLTLQTKRLNLGQIMKDSAQYGLVTSAFRIHGKGLDPHTASAAFKGTVQSAVYRGYTYQDFALDGTVADQHAQLISSINNTAVHFELKATADMARKFPSLQLDWQIDTVDLHALHLVTDTLQFKGHLHAGFDDTNPDSLQGALKLYNLSLVKGTQLLKTDSILLQASRSEDVEDIQLHSEMADLDWKGHYKLTETAEALKQTINAYYHLDLGKDTTFTAQDWTMQLHLRVSPLVLALMPSLRGTDSIGMKMAFNSDQKDLNLQLLAPHIRMGDNHFNGLAVTAATREGQLRYGVNMKDGRGSGFDFYQTSLYGGLQDDHLTTTLLLKDIKGKNRYRLGGQLDKLKDGIKLAFNADSLLLNYDAWQVRKDNFIQYDSSGLIVHHFTISHNNDSMSVSSSEDAATAPIDVRFADFHLSTISHLIDQDSLLVEGLLNGKAEIKNLFSSPVFTSDLTIQHLSYKTDSIGDLAIKVNNQTANALSADISLEGSGNDIKIKGQYYTGEGRMDLKLMLGRLNLGSFARAAQDEVEAMSGALKGQLSISGTMNQPLLKGNLYFDSARIVPVISGEPLKLSNDKIEFDEDGFNFSKFRLQDSAGNKLTIDGNAFTKTYRDYSFDISLNAGNFRLVNAPEASSRQFYGTLNLDAAINLEGNMNAPKVDGDVRINKKTNFYFVLPGEDPELVSREGVVRFVDKDHPGDTLIDRAAQILKARKAPVQGLDVSMNIQTDSSAILTMVIDERTGEGLTVRGRSNLVFGMDKSGKMDLTGSFEVESGSYNLSLDVLKRKFDIQRGSTITWTGDPTAAVLDLTAAYTANTPSLDLIANEVAGRSQTDINKFKQKLPFLVSLKMEGELMKPKITFDITLPPNVLTLWPDVDQKLQQIRAEESELNKQVFALLLLNRFVGDDPLQSAAGGGSTVGNMAFQSASQILTNQLDQLAGSLIKGVDINFDLNNQQDFSTGAEQDYTELNVSVSKQLFNDRIKVSVGSDFDVQGENNPGQQTSNIAGDVAVDYKLTKDGRYMLRAYRKNQYEAVVEGQVVESGLSFILTFDYNKLKEIFQKTRDEKLNERSRSKPAQKATPSNSSTPANSTTPKNSNQQ